MQTKDISGYRREVGNFSKAKPGKGNQKHTSCGQMANKVYVIICFQSSKCLYTIYTIFTQKKNIWTDAEKVERF